MKPTIFVLVALAIGVSIGVAITRQEFSRDLLPPELTIVTTTGTAAAPSPTPVSAAKNAPRAIVVNGERHDFGSMSRGALGQHTFVIRNDGATPLKLAKKNVTCKCTTFKIDKEELAPGETTNVYLEWRPAAEELHFEQSAEVLAENDPLRPVIALTISGRVIDIARPERWEMLLTDISANEASHMRLKIFCYSGARFEIAKHEWVNPTHTEKFRVRFEPLTSEEIAAEKDATSGVAVLLDVDPGLPLGSIDETLRLTPSLVEVKPMDIRVRGSVASDLLLAGPRVVPEKLLVNLGNIDRAVGLKTTVLLLVKGPFRDSTQLSLTAVEPSGELVVKLGEPDRSNPKVVRYPVSLEIPAGTSPVARSSEGAHALVKLAATHPQFKELTLKIRYVVKE